MRRINVNNMLNWAIDNGLSMNSAGLSRTVAAKWETNQMIKETGAFKVPRKLLVFIMEQLYTRFENGYKGSMPSNHVFGTFIYKNGKVYWNNGPLSTMVDILKWFSESIDNFPLDILPKKKDGTVVRCTQCVSTVAILIWFLHNRIDTEVEIPLSPEWNKDSSTTELHPEWDLTLSPFVHTRKTSIIEPLSPEWRPHMYEDSSTTELHPEWDLILSPFLHTSIIEPMTFVSSWDLFTL